jgi:oligoribonuclease NrnB/cAMP/cGMP phosphodiesterase (DHH superfamily)
LGVENIPRKKKTDEKSEPEPEEKQEPEIKEEPEPEPEEKPESASEELPVEASEPVSEEDSEPEIKEEPEKVPEPKPEEEPETIPEEKPETKSEDKPEPKPEEKPETKPEEKLESEPEKEPEPELDKEPEDKPEFEPEPAEVFDITDGSKKVTIIAHNDCDGVLSAATVLKAIKQKGGEEPKIRAFFTTPSKIFSTLAESIPQIPPGKSPFSIGDLYICDLDVHRDTLLGSTIYDNIIWVDHHIKETFVDELQPELPSVTLIIDQDADSAADLVAKYFEITSGFETMANNIDINDAKNPEEERLRDLVSALNMKYSKSPNELSKHLFQLANICSEDIFNINDEKYNAILEEYQEWLSKMNESLTKNLKIHEVNNKNVAVFETQEPAPVWALFNSLKDHEKGPFDLFAVLLHRPGGKKDRSSIGNPLTKIEFRTQTDLNVYDIAKSFGGGGHKSASGAVVTDGIKSNEFIKRIESSGFI